MSAKSESFGSVVKMARLAKGLGLREVARQFQMSSAYISRVESDLDDPSGQLIAQMAKLYGIPVEELTRRTDKPKASAAAHGHAVQASAELRALYRLGAQMDAIEIEGLIRQLLRQQGATEREIEKQLAHLKSELPRLVKSGRDGLFAAEAKPRFLSKQRIASMANDLLERNGITPQSYAPPTRIELLVENEPGLFYRIEKLKCDRHGTPLVLGLTGWDDEGQRQIVINSVLADSNRDSDEDRFNFTLGHELFHALEHLPRVSKSSVARLSRVQGCDAVFVDRLPTSAAIRPRSPAERAVTCWVSNSSQPRNLSTDEDWREWQSNVFSSSLLMPIWAVRNEFQNRLEMKEMLVERSSNFREAALQIAGKRVFGSKIYDQSLCDLFGVSRQAMAIRLLELNLLQEVKS